MALPRTSHFCQCRKVRVPDRGSAAILLSLSTHNGMPFILLVMAVLAIVYTFIANKTVLGRHVYMVGGNPKAAKLSGVRTDLVMLAVYTNMAFLSTIAGFVVAGRLNAASPEGRYRL